VCGNGIKHLNEHGIATTEGVLEAECRALNEVFFKFMSTGIPFVTLKFAQTLDGRIATSTGDSKWISGEKFRKLAHKMRATHDAVLVGIDTVLADDPELTVRLVKGRNPTRVILDSRLRIPPKAKVLTSDAPTIIAATPGADEKKLSRLREMGMEVLVVAQGEKGEVDLKELLKMLAERNISSVLVEGGGGVITSFLRQKLVDKMVVAIAPKIMGKGIEAVGDLNIRDASQSLKLDFQKVYRLGEDVVIEGRLL
jgi:diaminohydroxyphosphoribosylaminopyrimidine deaminase/5-amino-6-(5-phosphoribosylamino)uracil reductase